MRIMVLAVFTILIASGCAGVLNPYDSDFTCPHTYGGKCVSIQEAYKTSLDPNFEEPVPNDYLYEYNSKTQDKGSENHNQSSSKKKNVISLEESQGDSSGVVGSSYTEALYNEIRGLLKEPNTPIVRPPKIMRILVLAYPEGKNNLYMPRYIYTIVDDPKWVVVDPYMLNRIETEDNY